MKIRRGTIAAFAVLGLVACSGGDDATDDRAKTIDPPAATAPSESDSDVDVSGRALDAETLKGALLTVADMPTGFTVDPDTSDDPSTSECGKRYDKFQEANRERPSAEAAFTKGSFGPFVNQVLVGFDEEDAAGDRVAEFQALVQDCPKYSEKDADDGTMYNFSYSPLSFPTIGDETFAVAISIEGGPVVVGAHLVVARVGSTAMSIGNAGVGGADAAITEQVTRKAVTKLQAAAT